VADSDEGLELPIDGVLARVSLPRIGQLHSQARRAVLSAAEDRFVELLDRLDVDLIKAPHTMRRVLKPVRWPVVVAAPSHRLWQRFKRPEPLADAVLCELEHRVSWLRTRIDTLMTMANPEWRAVQLFTFAMNELLANIAELGRYEPQAAIVLLEHYLDRVSGIIDDVHDETQIPEFCTVLAQKALELGSQNGIDRRH
jgi:hypothetical protein